MKFSLSKLFLLVLIASIAALAVGKHINSPERRIRAAGVSYDLNRRGGTFLTLANPANWHDEKLAEIVQIAADFSEPHAIGILGGSVTDDGFKVFRSAPNIYSVVVMDLGISKETLNCFVGMPDLKYLTITDCPKIDESAIHEFNLKNPEIEAQSF